MRTYIFDLDGVIYRGEIPQPDAKETVERLCSRGETVFFLTNNSSRTREQYAARLASMGIPTMPEQVMTSGYATALYLASADGRGRKAYVIGEKALREALESVGIGVTEDDDADYVVVGLDTAFTYEKLRRAHEAILRGARFIATNCDATYPLEGSRLVPGCGSIVAAIQTASGVKPMLIGKPETYCARLILDAAGAKPEETIVVGDRLDTDVLMARRLGAKSVLVLGGVATIEDVEQAPPDLRPDVIIRRLGELLETCTHNSRL